jgi:hypothetical protein
MLVTAEGSARRLIDKYRLRAVFVAMERLNQSIDRRDFHAGDFWAHVVQAIHEFQRAGALSVDGYWLRTQRDAQRLVRPVPADER